MTTDPAAPHEMSGPDPERPIRLLAPAKLTTVLRVTGTRPDGFHLIDAEMVSLDLCDELEVTPGADGLSLSGPHAEGLRADADNLVARALAVTGRRAAVHLVKHIPHGGGLGGGSSDAAAILRWAGVRDPDTAATLGADVPFCVVGGRARVTGIGEIVEPLAFEDRTFTLVMPPFATSTPAVYRAWDELGGPRGTTNDLEPAALAVDARLGHWRYLIAEATGVEPVLAGSGSTWFVDGERDAALDHLREHGARVLTVRTVGPS